MVNHNRYVYDSDEECGGNFPQHSVPFGNWGAGSNVGSAYDGHQFQGWYAEDGWEQWNSCAADYVKPDLNCERLNFPDSAGVYPYPANGYPFSDPFTWNDSVPPYGTSACVDQISDSGLANHYGTATRRIPVTNPEDSDCDGIMDTGGCLDLDGRTLTVQDNYMTLYELDHSNLGINDDLVQSLYFADVSVTLACTVEGCSAVGDDDHDGWIDNVNERANSAYVWPVKYQDDWDVVCYASGANVPCKRADATIRVGGVTSFYNGDLCDWACATDPSCE